MHSPVRFRPPARRTASPAHPPTGCAALPENTRDPEQERAIDLLCSDLPVVVLGAPGTGKSSTLVECVAALTRQGVSIDEILTLAPTRDRASVLRQQLSDRLRIASSGPLARTPHSLAFGLVRARAAALGDPAPTFISGPEQDSVLRALLDGHSRGEGREPEWPAGITAEVRATDGFRHELREVLMRAMEWGLSAEDLSRLGHERQRPEWLACADVLEEYEQVAGFQLGGGYDPAAVVATATGLLRQAAGAGLSAGAAVGFANWRVPKYVVVDDIQDLTEAGARLVDALALLGARCSVFGDPDATTEGFRGAEPRLVAAAASGRFGVSSRVVTLRNSWRQPAALRAVTERVSSHIGVAGVASQRRTVQPEAGERTGAAETHLVGSAAAQRLLIAGRLRAAHLDHGVPWDQMAVVARSSSALGPLRRELIATGVPVGDGAPDIPLREEPAVRPMLLAMHLVSRDELELSADQAVELLCSRIGGADGVELRRLRVALRAEERHGGGSRSSDELLAEAVIAPERLLTLGAAVTPAARRVAAMLAAGRKAAAAGPHELLWEMWNATGLAGMWQQAALSRGRDQDAANADLDAMMRLFAAAEKFDTLFPGARSTAFLEHVFRQSVTEDSLAQRAAHEDAVTLTTAAGASGREWDFVVIPDVQEGSWPNLTLRGSLLGAGDIVDAVLDNEKRSGRAQRRETLDDELRTFAVACSRARKQLIVTAVRDEDAAPSAFVSLVAPEDGGDDEAARPLTVVPRALTLRGIAASLRAELEASIEAMQLESAGRGVEPPELALPGWRSPADDGAGLGASAAARALARLARENVPGAHPAQWYGQLPVSSAGKLVADGQPISVSPSRVESFQTCGLRWFLESHGGRGPDSLSQTLGNLVHELAAEFPQADAAQLREQLELRADELTAQAPWIAESQRRRAEAIVSKLGDYQSAHREALVDVEREFSTQIGRASLRGRVDRIERDADGKLVVIDLKTGKSKPAAADLERHPQLGSYQAAVGAGAFPEGNVSGGARLVQLASGVRTAIQEQPPLQSDDDPLWATSMVLDVAEGMAAGAFTARENQYCSVCPVRSSCPVQHESRLP
ncbi:ATP-dependent DNA helicase [Saxibacter everestensis]|uniref:DNA 3'-5' helicase n=1 Tax=Saxibacter everestensis TaxID=2909229 RepID=A0ABY8QNJ7_9MICO|nr:ATP-dependent DNA helicase [Brevibacteriaceae bacterium ZFBP1038]